MCTDCKNGHCHSCHREIVGADHHESDGVYCEPCASYRLRITELETERDTLKERLEVTKQASAIFEENSKHCSEEFEKRLKAEVERDRLREMVRKLIPWTGACPDYFSDKDDCGKCEHCITRREAENYIAASIGGEGE